MKFGTGAKIVQTEHNSKLYLKIVEVQPILSKGRVFLSHHQIKS